MSAIRAPRVIAFCDWLDTIPPQPPFHTRAEFRRYRDLTAAEMDAAKAEMRRRAQAASDEADALEQEFSVQLDRSAKWPTHE